MKTATLLALLPAASAFVTPAPKMARGRALRMDYSGEPGAVKFFPDSQGYWDPLKLAKNEETFNKYQAAEVKHGRIAMLAAADYLAHNGLGWKLPGALGDVPISSIPTGLAALDKVPLLGWTQILIFASALEILAPQKEDKVPGNVQPDTDVFPVPGDVTMRTREINNGRLAMVASAGILVGEYVSGGKTPTDNFVDWIQTWQ